MTLKMIETTIKIVVENFSRQNISVPIGCFDKMENPGTFLGNQV